MQPKDSSIQIEHISGCFEEDGQDTDNAMFNHLKMAVMRGHSPPARPQSCGVCTIYYHEHQGSLHIDPSEGSTVSMPLLGTKDLPSFIYDTSSCLSILRLAVNQFSNYGKVDWHLFNTFDKLEGEVWFSLSPPTLFTVTM
ncbi:hypothetical protein RJ640_003612 [Escallonia rubra]|uniref:Uncharacterized protein n=1 Tax=Escallonia rubra TaxID=112253 RepID=A0AA88SGY4_9ASTE|nr:hypothetical protein RJ640_003612 [Escallonia rubra]